MLKQSSRRNPCPVCGRNADGDCRFSEDLILCHQGTRFGPPQHLRLGDVIDVNGVRWALIRSDAGFDGAAHEFRPDRGGTPKRTATLAAPVARVQELSAKKRLREFNAEFREAMKCPALDLLTADEVAHYPELIVCLAEEGQEMEPLLVSLASKNLSWKRHLKTYLNRLKAINYARDEVVRFYRIPTGEDIAALERGDE